MVFGAGNEEILGYVILGCMTYLIGSAYYDSVAYQLKCIVSTDDGKHYCVRERSKLKDQKAVNLLAMISGKLETLVSTMSTKYPDKENVKRMSANFNPGAIRETLPTSDYTAYSENKGENIAFCLNKNSKTDNSELIDENTLTFVALHELAHLATESIGHTDEFWSNFKFILEEADEQGLYTPINYKQDNETYCGMTIKDNPYFDYQ